LNADQVVKLITDLYADFDGWTGKFSDQPAHNMPAPTGPRFYDTQTGQWEQ